MTALISGQNYSLINVHSQIVPENCPALISVLDKVSVTSTDVPDVPDNLGVVCAVNRYETAVSRVTSLVFIRMRLKNMLKCSKSVTSGVTL